MLPLMGYMSIRTSMNVSLTPELEQFVQSRVASGLYQTASEVVREGLRLLEERERARETALADLRAKIRRGVEQADRGELLDGDAVFEEIRQLSARRQADSKYGGGLSSPEARADLIGIWNYIAEDSIDAADQVLARLYDAFTGLGQTPGIGHHREDLADLRHRFWTVYSYVIAYRWETTPIQIIAVGSWRLSFSSGSGDKPTC
jgi:antitoxin ParD1/3/4